MVLRLMLVFVKRGTDDAAAELEEIAVEALKNLLKVLLSMRVLGFTPAKGSNSPTPVATPAASPGASPRGDSPKSSDQPPPVWWQMTWDCIEVFLPGFGDEFSKAAFPSEAPVLAEPQAANKAK